LSERRRDILEAFTDDPFAVAVGSVRAISCRRRSSSDEAVCLAFSTERSMAERLAGIGRSFDEVVR